MPEPSPAQQTDLNLINQALTAMGERGTISDLTTDDSVAAQVMREHYDTVIEACLTRTAWRFATKKAALNKLSAVPENRWAAAWQLPTDKLKVLYVFPPINYELQGRRLFTNATSGVVLDYIRRVGEGEFPPWFRRYAIARLVMRTVKGITGDAPAQDMRDEDRDALTDALFQDAQQQPNQTRLPNDFIDVRY